MKTDLDHLTKLIDLERLHQQQVVRWALTRLLEEGQRGVVLADEVGCGKTYEALAIMALLWRQSPRKLRRVLVLAPPNLVRKWHEELTANDTRPDSQHGLRPYLLGDEWKKFNQQFIEQVYLIESRGGAFQGVRKDGRLQAPVGLYLVNRNLLYASKRGSDMPKPLKYILNTKWDLVIVDEAHHFGKGNACDSLFAAEGGSLGPDHVLEYDHILLLTATPFELDPNEMINLLSIAGADDECDRLERLLKDYQQGLADFYNLRTLESRHPRREKAVDDLGKLRVGVSRKDGLESSLGRWIARNSKEAGRRVYSLVNYVPDQASEPWQTKPFDKFDDLKRLCAELPLIPFGGPHALAYLELRTLMQEINEQSSSEGEPSGTFVSMDLQQGLSSYQQLLAKSDKDKPKRLLERDDLERAGRLRQLLESWTKADNTDLDHPKVQALGHVVHAIVLQEIDRLERDPQVWFAKIVVFNKLVTGTAPYLNNYLQQQVVRPLLEDMLERLVQRSQFSNVKQLRKAAHKIVDEETDRARAKLTEECRNRGENRSAMLDTEIWVKAGFNGIKRATHAVTGFRRHFRDRVGQSLFLIDFLRSTTPRADKVALREFIHQSIIDPVVDKLDDLINRYFDSQPDEEEIQRLGEARFKASGIQQLKFLRERFRSPRVVARYDGSTYEDRESNRINFNDRWNPLVLIVSRVGEEGIDLQKQARYILHYDLEWNPAKMEQREGRVDREGYGHGDRPIDVRFFLLKGTYEERIFHTVMQRDQWFQILMGSQRRQLGTVGSIDGPDTGDPPDPGLAMDSSMEHSIGKLTPKEKETVMLDLRPRQTYP